MRIEDVVQKGPVVPVITINAIDEGLKLVETLRQGGISVFEITLRTAHALTAIDEIIKAFPDIVVGAGTVRNSQQLDSVLKLGVYFAVSPGLPSSLVAAVKSTGIAFLPGVATVTEMMQAYDEGFAIQKLFPAEAVGGVKLLKSIYPPLSDIVFCPTGGINADNAQQYLDLPNVVCVGGSWLSPESLIRQQRWEDVLGLAKAASDLSKRRA